MTSPLTDLIAAQAIWEARANEAQGKAAQAYARLMDIANSDTGQSTRVRRFIAASFNGVRYRFDLFGLRALDFETSDGQ